MSSLKEMKWHPRMVPRTPSWAAREIGAAMLRGASARLARLALLVAARPAAPVVFDPCFEFHAEAGAPEGALYVDGRLVGWLRGVRRL